MARLKSAGAKGPGASAIPLDLLIDLYAILTHSDVPYRADHIGMTNQRLFRSRRSWDRASWLELIVVHADERGLQRQAGCLLGGALAGGGHPASGPTSHSYVEIVHFPERARTR
jgi:hypothetical protein